MPPVPRDLRPWGKAEKEEREGKGKEGKRMGKTPPNKFLVMALVDDGDDDNDFGCSNRLR